jgi:hypothetical protein
MAIMLTAYLAVFINATNLIPFPTLPLNGLLAVYLPLMWHPIGAIIFISSIFNSQNIHAMQKISYKSYLYTIYI